VCCVCVCVCLCVCAAMLLYCVQQRHALHAWATVAGLTRSEAAPTALFNQSRAVLQWQVLDRGAAGVGWGGGGR
jgi:hypothetical protein